MERNGAVDLRVEIGRGLRLKNPVMTASGTFGYGEEFADLFDLRTLGAIVVKGISLRPRGGNPSPRVVETPSGMLNAIGLQNIGIERFLSEKLPRVRRLGPPIVVNVLGFSTGEYCDLVSALDGEEGVSAIELNVSCPNVSHGGVAFGTDPAVLEGLVGAVRARTELPLIVKLSPNVSDIREIAKAAARAGADCLSLINTITAMTIDVDTMRPVLANVTGGLSGPAIRPIAVRMVWEASRSVDIPVIGIGGIMDARDALEFILAGASAIQVGTANLVNPNAATQIVDGMMEYCRAKGSTRIRELVGRAILP